MFTPLLCKVHWPAVYFWEPFKVLVTTFEALQGMGLGSLRNHHTALGLARPTHASTGGMLEVPSAKKFWQAGI